MKIYRTILIDDEKQPLDNLKNLLRNRLSHFDVVGTADCYSNAVDVISAHRPDLVFLDIQLKEQKNGFDIIKDVEFKDFQVVFTTSFDKYAIQAIKCSALDYLLKPVLEVHLNELLKTMRIKDQNELKYIALIENLQLSSAGKFSLQFLPILHQEYEYNFQLQKIDAFESKDEKYCRAISLDHSYDDLIITKTLKEMEDILSGMRNFLRVHKKHILNIDAITKKYRNLEQVKTRTGKEINIGDTHRSNLRNRLLGF